MNGTLVIFGMLMVSIFVAGMVVYHIGLMNDTIEPGECVAIDQSSLNEDLKDILAFIPLDEVDDIVKAYIKHDKQIGNITIGFINDSKKFIIKEFRRMQEFHDFVTFVGYNGLEVDYWNNKLQELWKDMPTYIKADDSIACGGLTVMVNKILKIIPKEELHELLRQKAKYSGSFRSFIQAIRSDGFADLCDAIEENKVLQRHYFWANDEGIEVVFGLELLKNFYRYMTEELL